MNPVKASLHYPQVTLLLTAAVFVAGIYSLTTMPRREDPKITIRTGLVVALYPGATAEQVEKQLTKKIEDRLFRFEEVRKGKSWSTSRNNLAVINVELEDNVREPDVFWSKLRLAMAELKQTELPEGVRGPIIRDDFGDTVAQLIALHGANYDYQQLKEYAQRIEDEFRTSRAVAKLARIGEQSEEIRVTGSTERLAQYSLSPLRIIEALKMRNIVQFAGMFDTPTSQVPLKATGLFQTEDEIRRVMVDMSPTGQPVYLGDLAEVERIDADARTLCRFNGERALLVSVEMLEGSNIVDFGKELKSKLEAVRLALPPDLKIDLVADQPAVVEDRISHFVREFGIAIASVIVVTVLLLPFRVAVIASFAIPVTVAATFAVLNVIGIELHQVSIAALIVVLGMVVDDAIVIADNYVELLDHGVPRDEAAWRCATELVVPVLTATATIIAAFLPMLLISGVVGEFIQALPIAVSVALTCSFVIAMLLTPWLCHFFIKQGLHSEPAQEKAGFSILDSMQRGYKKAITVAMSNEKVTLLTGIAFVGLSVFLLLKAVPQRFFPTAERPQFVINLWLPEGSKLDATDRAVQRIEEYLKRQPLVKDYSSFIGQSAPRFYYNVDPEFPSTNYAQLLVNTKEEKPTPPFVYHLRRELKSVAPEALVFVRELEQGTPTHAPIEVRIVSSNEGANDLRQLKTLGTKVEDIFHQTPGVDYIYQDFHQDSFDLDVKVDEEVANRLGLSNVSIAMQLAGGFSGAPVTTFWEGDRDVPVVLRLDQQYRQTFQNIEDSYVVSSLTGAKVPLRSVAALEPAWRPSRILHRNGVRTLTVLAIADEHHLSSELLKVAKQPIASLSLPPGYRIEYGGEVEGQEETFGEMSVVLELSVSAIFLILLLQFRSPIQVLVIMMAVPLAMPGAVIGLLLTRNPFSFTAFLGLISLSGVVVRNAIILIEYINERRAAGVALRDAALEAGERRLRPIFLTTAAAAVGVTPMIVSGSSLWSPLASVIAVGLLLSMFFTLLVIPVLYVVCERRFERRVPLVGVILSLLVFNGNGLYAESRQMTIDEAIALARKQNSYAKLARLKVQENMKKRDAIKANQFPQLTNDSSVVYNSALQNLFVPRGYLGTVPIIGPLPTDDLKIIQGENLFGLSVTTLGQPITQLIKIRQGTRAAAQDIKIAEQDQRRAENEIALKTQEAYLGVLILERRLEAARRKVAAAEEMDKEVKDAVATGAALDVKALEGEAGLLQQKNVLLSAELQLSDLRAELNDLVDIPLDTRLDLIMPDTGTDDTTQIATVTDEALRNNPEVRAAEETVVKAKHGLAAAKAERIPEISAFAQYTAVSGIPFLPSSNGAVGARLNYTLFDWGKRNAQIAERQFQIEQAEENLRRLRNRAAIDVQKAYRKVERVRDLVRVAERAAAVRKEARRVAVDQVELGLATVRVQMEAEAALAEAEAQTVEARLGLRLARAELDRVAGR